jgi:peptidoglycan hydrolase CwlO-like protein
MDENKILDLLEKIYVAVQDTKSEIKNHTERFNNVENRLDTIQKEVKKLGITIDENLIPTDNAILDGYKDTAEHITIIDNKIDRLQINVNSISMKVSSNDSRIIEISKDLKKSK